LRRDGFGLVAVSYDPVSVLADFSARRGITFPLLSDQGSVVITKYGILNTTVARDNSTYGIPFPGTFIVNAKGVVTSRYFEPTYQERNTMTSILVKLGATLDVAATSVAAAHLQLTTYLTDQAAAPGTHFSVVVDAAPAAHVHVYAPGAVGYKPIALTIDPQPGLVVRDALFPRPDDYFFKPLNEHVSVYQKQFRVVQDLEIDPAPAAAAALNGKSEMTIRARFEYQACDDKVCFNPQSVPLTWTIALRPLDRERSKR
jgi:hypothetical protein